MKVSPFLFVLFCAGLFACTVPVLASPPPGGEGYVTFLCSVDGATVYLDGSYAGTITDGSLDVADGVSHSTYTVKADGYYDASGDINYVPGGSPNIEITVTLTQKPVGSGKGWITVHSNVDGASVAFDGTVRGTTAGGTFTLQVSTTGSPYTSYTVSKEGYVSATAPISRMPADGETIDLYATLNPVPTSVPTTQQSPIGGDEGWYSVICNVDGASVYFDDAYKGRITSGSLTVPVYSTGTPYTSWRVEKSGYETATGTLPAAPAKGKTATVYATLDPVSTETPTPLPTTGAPGSGKGYLVIHANVDGATVSVGSYTVGTIKNGILRVPVSTTGTPYSGFTVSKPGYVTTTGTVPRQPAAGETVDIYVVLTPEQTTPPATESPLSALAAVAGILCAVLVLCRRGA